MKALGAALHRFVMRRAGRLAGLHTYRVMVRELAPPSAPYTVPGVELRVLAPAELRGHCADATLDLTPSAAREALERGEGCLGALENGTLAGYLWFAFGPAPHRRGTWAEFPPGTAYLYRTFVRPSHRGRGIATALFRRADGAILPPACRRTLACVELHNYASAGALRTAGFRSAGMLASWQSPFGESPRLHLWRSAKARQAGFRFSPGPGPRPRLSGRTA